ncbi:hypothetical protein AB0M58_27845 [Streptomyces bobili]|uniref:hypothetical protein n=1 Tax=Streptomyces bobili TaxID=67280 RepID=UPI0034265601
MRRRPTAVPAVPDSTSHRHHAGARGNGGTTRLRQKAAATADSNAVHLPAAQERQAL